MNLIATAALLLSCSLYNPAAAMNRQSANDHPTLTLMMVRDTYVRLSTYFRNLYNPKNPEALVNIPKQFSSVQAWYWTSKGSMMDHNLPPELAFVRDLSAPVQDVQEGSHTTQTKVLGALDYLRRVEKSMVDKNSMLERSHFCSEIQPYERILLRRLDSDYLSPKDLVKFMVIHHDPRYANVYTDREIQAVMNSVETELKEYFDWRYKVKLPTDTVHIENMIRLRNSITERLDGLTERCRTHAV